MAEKSSIGDFSNRELEWSLENGDTATPANPTSSGPLGAAVEFSGTWGGATMKLQVSNDSVTWFDAVTPADVAISATSDAIFELSTGARYLRPVISGGSGSVLGCIIYMRG